MNFSSVDAKVRHLSFNTCLVKELKKNEEASSPLTEVQNTASKRKRKNSDYIVSHLSNSLAELQS